MMGIGEFWGRLGSAIGSITLFWAMFQNLIPYEFRGFIMKYIRKLRNFMNPYIQIAFYEYQDDRFERSKNYIAIQRYLSAKCSSQAKRLKAGDIKGPKALIFSMDDYEEVSDEFKGIKLKWVSNSSTYKSVRQASFFNSNREEEVKYFMLTFHKKHRELVTNSYLNYVLEEGKAISTRNRQRKLYTNSKKDGMFDYPKSSWSHVCFEHPATFDTLAMEPRKKQEIKDDLIKFSQSKDYYAKIGKAWKRGYLLHGPPGTGKSTMIAAMANLLNYDVYDLELTAVKDNTELRKLLIHTSSKSIIVIEDIDCSLDVTGQRESKKDEKKKDNKLENDPVTQMMKADKEKKNSSSEVTLSGLLNFIDGLWSAIGGERLIVFTTNHIEKLDPALIREGRMDKHIELSYSCFEAFKVLAKNYLDIEFHNLFPEIKCLLEEAKITPASVAENLMPKSVEEDVEACLQRLIKFMERSKQETILKAQEEAKLRAKKEEEEIMKEVDLSSMWFWC